MAAMQRKGSDGIETHRNRGGRWRGATQGPLLIGFGTLNALASLGLYLGQGLLVPLLPCLALSLAAIGIGGWQHRRAAGKHASPGALDLLVRPGAATGPQPSTPLVPLYRQPAAHRRAGQWRNTRTQHSGPAG